MGSYILFDDWHNTRQFDLFAFLASFVPPSWFSTFWKRTTPVFAWFKFKWGACYVGLERVIGGLFYLSEGCWWARAIGTAQTVLLPNLYAPNAVHETHLLYCLHCVVNWCHSFLVPQIPNVRSCGSMSPTHLLFCPQWSQREISEPSQQVGKQMFGYLKLKIVQIFKLCAWLSDLVLSRSQDIYRTPIAS